MKSYSMLKNVGIFEKKPVFATHDPDYFRVHMKKENPGEKTSLGLFKQKTFPGLYVD